MSREKALRRLKVLEGLVVGEDDERRGAGFEESRPMLNRLDDSEKLAVVRAVTAFDIGHLARPVTDRTKPVGVALRKDGGNGEPRGIGFQLGRDRGIKVAEQNGRGKCGAKLVK